MDTRLEITGIEIGCDWVQNPGFEGAMEPDLFF